ncbi:LSM domain-containing protein [Falsibacillus pallidus]|uniref:LSM domain-containing protein n=1 Tax=Falsibacillus pallidus TaxID=493781 RepID=A0A370G812_9BACI|nr:LSM domain-containing protein [Falsibacillus pallidus]RDI39935.1 LSM domain-containing protein [Falsibacillus pallidus]
MKLNSLIKENITVKFVNGETITGELSYVDPEMNSITLDLNTHDIIIPMTSVLFVKEEF